MDEMMEIKNNRHLLISSIPISPVLSHVFIQQIFLLIKYIFIQENIPANFYQYINISIPVHGIFYLFKFLPVFPL
jgi:hypothetical protein